MDYRSHFYDKYVATHIIPRKGEIDINLFYKKSINFNKVFGKFLPSTKDAKIIDLGCGYGNMVWWLQNRGFYDAEGIDISAEQIEIGREFGIINLAVADIREYLTEKENTYDVIFARDVLEHFSKNEIIAIMPLCFSSLKNQGALIIQVPNAESPFGGRSRYGDFTHEISFTVSSLSQLLRMTGFTKFDFFSTQPRVTGVRSFIRFILWKFVESIYKFLLFAEQGFGRKIVTQGLIAVARKTKEY